MRLEPTRLELLELDLDCRMSELWTEANTIETWNLDIVAAFLRAAYGKGYADALTEPVEGELCSLHGYRQPKRRAA